MQRPFRHSRSFKVTDFGTNQKLMTSYVINTNLPPILHRFQVMPLAIGECLTVTLSLGWSPANVAINHISLKTIFFDLHFRCRKFWRILWNLKCPLYMCYHWVVTERNSRICSTSTVDPNLSDLNPVDCSLWLVLEEKLYKICIIDLNELKQRLRTVCAMLDHVVIVAAVRHWRHW